jgi:hypothetical protein
VSSFPGASRGCGWFQAGELLQCPPPCWSLESDSLERPPSGRWLKGLWGGTDWQCHSFCTLWWGGSLLMDLRLEPFLSMRIIKVHYFKM